MGSRSVCSAARATWPTLAVPGPRGKALVRTTQGLEIRVSIAFLRQRKGGSQDSGRSPRGDADSLCGCAVEGTSQTRRLSAPLAWQASRLHGAMKRRAHFLFKRRTDQQLNDFDKREALRRNQGLVLERMDPHVRLESGLPGNGVCVSLCSRRLCLFGPLFEKRSAQLPNFGVTDKTELHITVDAEQGEKRPFSSRPRWALTCEERGV